MGLMATLFGGKSASIPSEYQGVSAWLNDIGGGGRQSTAGVTVTESSAMSMSAVFACVRAISEDTAKLPLKLYKQLVPRGKELLRDDPLYKLLKSEPNPEMGSFDFRCALMASAIMWHGGFAEIERNGFGDAIALWPIHPSRVKIKRDEQQRLYYEVSNSGKAASHIKPENMLHIKGFGDSGLAGWMMATVARDSIGVYKAAEQFTASFFKNGATLSGVIELGEGHRDQAQLDTYLEKVNRVYGGMGSLYKLMVLNKGSQFKQISIDPEKSQLLNTVQFRVEDVARWFRVPPHIIGHLARATFSNIEHQGLEYLANCLDPWLTKTEQELGRKLLASPQHAGAFFEHIRDKILMSDTKSRFEAYNIAITAGFMTRNEARDKENLNPFEGGDRFLVQQNLAIVDEDGDIQPANKPGESATVNTDTDIEDDEDDAAHEAMAERAKLAAMPVLVDAATRLITREVNAIRAKKDVSADWLNTFYEGHEGQACAAYQPPVDCMLRMLGLSPAASSVIAAQVASEHVGASRKMLAAGDDLSMWQATRPALIATHIIDKVMTHADANQTQD